MGLNSPADPHLDFFNSCLAKCNITKLRLETSFPLSLPPLGLQNHNTCFVLCYIIRFPSELQTWVWREFGHKKLWSLSFLLVVLSQTHNCLTTARTATAVARINNKFSAIWLAYATAKWGRKAGTYGTESENTFYWIPFSTLEPDCSA